MASALTTKSVEAAKPGEGRREVPDGLLTGLYLVVQPTGAKSWAIRYRHAGKPRKLALGPLAPTLDGPEPEPILGAPMTLGGARKIARAQLLEVAAGRDPAADRQAAKAAALSPEQADRDLVKTHAAQFLARYLKPRARPGYYKSVEAILDGDVLPRWGERRIQEIARRDVLDLIDKVVERGAPVQANRVLAAIRKFFNWTVSRDIIAVSPAAGVKPPTPETSRERVLGDDELRHFWLASESLGFPFGPLGKLVLLTGTRRGEAAGLRRSELSGDGLTWTLPAARAKNSRALSISLSAPARAAIAEAPVIALSKADIDAGLPRHGKRRDLVFSTTGRTPVSGFARWKERLDTAMLAVARKEAIDNGTDPDEVIVQPWTFHDLRRTTASGMARLGVALPVVEKCLNHASGSFGGIVGVYQRHSFADEMAAAFKSWGDHVDSITAPSAPSDARAATVTDLAAARRQRNKTSTGKRRAGAEGR
jgi:integrase